MDEMTVTITLNEYKKLIKENCVKDFEIKDLKVSNSKLEVNNSKLFWENKKLKSEIDGFQKINKKEMEEI